MFPDRDEPGERLFLQLQKVLPQLVHHQLPPGCKDYSDYYLKMKNEEGCDGTQRGRLTFPFGPSSYTFFLCTSEYSASFGKYSASIAQKSARI